MNDDPGSRPLLRTACFATALVASSACKDGAPAATQPPVSPPIDPGGRVCTGATRSSGPDATVDVPVPSGVRAPAGFAIDVVAKVPSARNLAALPNGDLLVGTLERSIYLVPRADAPKAGTASVFATFDDPPAHGVTFHEPSCAVYVGTRRGMYRMPYEDAQRTASPSAPVAGVRLGGAGGHVTTSVAVAGAHLFASVGSSCNACVESDPTRATVQRMNLDGSGMTTYARRIRNAIALATNPETGALWAGSAGQDALPQGHPYEPFDPVTAHPPGVDYGWPDCEENNRAYTSGASCAGTVAPRVVLPAYSTPIGAAFYPLAPSGAHAFPSAYRGGAFVALHGAWHKAGDAYLSAPLVVYVAMDGDAPRKAVDWNDPTTQWTEFVGGFETADRRTRVGRPAGVAVGRDGSLFVTDDDNGLVYRVRPAP